MRDYDDKLCFIERSVLELGSEVYKLKQELKTVRSSHKNILDQLKALRLLLDDGGVISLDDFDGAIDLAEAMAIDCEEYNNSLGDIKSKKYGH